MAADNVVKFPTYGRIEVTQAVDVITGMPMFIFERVEGRRRTEIAIYSNLSEVEAAASKLAAAGSEVGWRPTR